MGPHPTERKVECEWKKGALTSFYAFKSDVFDNNVMIMIFLRVLFNPTMCNCNISIFSCCRRRRNVEEQIFVCNVGKEKLLRCHSAPGMINYLEILFDLLCLH